MTLKEILEKERQETAISYEREQLSLPVPAWCMASQFPAEMGEFHALFKDCEDF